ncbi:hypothetical protein BU15DRAFT_55416 [Melanogaster broomeanus]|nr:hypothetical protein BU15DRAFT_55416 [Melanogaster broomeanus]
MLTHTGIPPYRLDLKVHAICALQCNLSVDKGLVHNARVEITALHQRFIEVRLLNDNCTHCIPCITFTFSPPHSGWTINHKQFPLRLAYATTFNGCQGLTLTRTVLDLHTDSFAHGQLYTALSRVRKHEDSMVLYNQSNDAKDTANVVYPQLLL